MFPPDHLPGRPQVRSSQVQVAVVGGTGDLSVGEELIRVHPIKHDRTREHVAIEPTPLDPPRHDDRSHFVTRVPGRDTTATARSPSGSSAASGDHGGLSDPGGRRAR